MGRSRLLVAATIAATLGVGSLILQRWVAETRLGAIELVAAWFAVVGIGAAILLARRPGVRLAAFAAFAAVLAVTVIAGYVFGFRDHRVNEDVVMASTSVHAAERASELAGSAKTSAAPAEPSKPAKPKGPVSLARGRFQGQDGHQGTGVAEIVRTTAGKRFLTFTHFDVSPGVQSVVYLTRDASSVDDRVGLGDLKGNVGNQQYEIPGAANLRAYDTVVVYCTPFTVRIATADLA